MIKSLNQQDNTIKTSELELAKTITNHSKFSQLIVPKNPPTENIVPRKKIIENYDRKPSLKLNENNLNLWETVKQDKDGIDQIKVNTIYTIINFKRNQQKI